ncbi:LytTR family DNA-binding domain-containing protein [soil metagenome]
MNKISAIIIDDEPGNIVTLEELLKSYCPEIEVAGTALNPVIGSELILRVNPQLVFLDIEMPYGNAFTMLDKLSPINFEVIFITAFNEYAVKAFKYAALDYILKPVNINELKAAVGKAVKRLGEKHVNTRVESLLSNMKPENQQAQKIGMPTPDGYRFESIQNILFLEANGSYTNVYIKDNVKEMVSKNLNYFDEILPAGNFCRVHHSYIININAVKKYFKGRGGYVEMENGAIIEISVRRKEDFLNKFVH